MEKILSFVQILLVYYILPVLIMPLGDLASVIFAHVSARIGLKRISVYCWKERQEREKKKDNLIAFYSLALI